MAFNNTIRQLTVDDTNHASNFNEINNKLLENDLFLNNSKATAETLTLLWSGTVTLSGTEQNLTLAKSMATARKIRLTFNAGAPITSIDIQPINEETVLRIGGNKYYAPVQAGATTGHIIIGFPTDTTCVVQGAVAWALSRITGVF